MSKKDTKIEAPKNNEISLNIGDCIKLELTIYLHNTNFGNLNYDEVELSNLIKATAECYLKMLGRIQNKKTGTN